MKIPLTFSFDINPEIEDPEFVAECLFRTFLSEDDMKNYSLGKLDWVKNLKRSQTRVSEKIYDVIAGDLYDWDIQVYETLVGNNLIKIYVSSDCGSATILLEIGEFYLVCWDFTVSYLNNKWKKLKV